MASSPLPHQSDFIRFRQDIARAYDEHIAQPEKQPQFFLLDSFLVTFSSVRFITHSIRSGRFRRVLHNVSGPGGLHVHHLVPGIISLLVFGYLGLSEPRARERAIHAVGFGAGAALTLDEFALWLNLQDVYWASKGRESIDAVVVATTLLTLGLMGKGFWVDVGHAVERLAGKIE